MVDLTREIAFAKKVSDAYADIVTGQQNMQTVLAMFDDLDLSNGATEEQINQIRNQLNIALGNNSELGSGEVDEVMALIDNEIAAAQNTGESLSQQQIQDMINAALSTYIDESELQQYIDSAMQGINLSGYYTKSEVDSMVSSLSSEPSLTEDQISQMIVNATANLEDSVSQEEMDAILAQISNSINNVDYVNLTTVQQLIQQAMQDNITGLTEEQVRAIVNDSVSGIVAGTTSIPDYSKGAVLFTNTSQFFPSGKAPAVNAVGNYLNGTNYVIENDGFISVYATYTTAASTTAAKIALSINNVEVASNMDYNVADSGTGYGAGFSTSPLPVLAGDTIKLGISVTPTASMTKATCTFQYFPFKVGTENASQSDLTNFTTAAQMTSHYEFDVEAHDSKANLTDFDLHRQTDKGRWDDLDGFEIEAINSIINGKGMKQDVESNVDISDYSSSTNMYHVTNELGGLLTVEITNTDVQYGTIVIDGVNRNVNYSTEGMVIGIPTTKYYAMADGDTAYVTNVDSAIFTPYIADPTTQMQQIVATNTSQNTTIGVMQQMIADLQASIQNKTIANQASIDITNTTFTVDNTLGARITGQGNQVLGLLGITVASTGTVTFTPLPDGVENYNNTALLSGTPVVFSYNVPDGTVIASSGMKYVTLYNYVQGS